VPILRYVIAYRDPDDGWTYVERFEPHEALAADRRVDALRRERPGVYRLWAFGTAGHRLLRDTERE
jgi:hypothetical protein